MVTRIATFAAAAAAADVFAVTAAAGVANNVRGGWGVRINRFLVAATMRFVPMIEVTATLRYHLWCSALTNERGGQEALLRVQYISVPTHGEHHGYTYFWLMSTSS